METAVPRIAIAGLGTVGMAVIHALRQHTAPQVDIVAVSARDKTKMRGLDLSGIKWVDTPLALANDKNIDVVVELIGGEDRIAYEVVKAALCAGKSVVTANKAMLAKHAVSLARLAEDNKATLYYEAAIAGGIPVVKTLREALIGNKVKRISGILNGTCNFILSEMTARGGDFSTILKQAQAKGYAEADPHFDVEGIDAAQKLTLLAALCFGIAPRLDDVTLSGITKIREHDIAAVKELGYTLRLVGVAAQDKTGILQTVSPMLIPQSHKLAHVMGVDNALLIEAEPIGSLLLQGPGAGGGATASAVIGDLADIVHGRKAHFFAAPLKDIQQNNSHSEAAACRWYLRLNISDKSGSMALVTRLLAEHDVSIEEIIQRAHSEKENEMGGAFLPVIFITHKTQKSTVEQALQNLAKHDTIKSEMIMLPVMES